MKPIIPTTRRNILETALGLGCILASATQTVHAASLYWDGPSAGWNAATNWSTVASAATPDPAAAPVATDDAIFNIDPVDGDATVTLNAAQAANSLVFRNTGATLIDAGAAAQILTVGAGGLSVDAAAGAVTIGGTNAVTVTLGAAQTWSNPSANPVTLLNPIASAGAMGTGAGLTKTGTGNVWFNNVANTHTINGTLDLQAGKIQTSGDLFLGGLTGAGTLECGGPNAKWVFVNTGSNQQFSGSIVNKDATARLGFVKRGTGALTLSGTNGPALDNFGIDAGKIILPTGSTVGVGGVNFGSVNVGNLNSTTTNGVLEISGGTMNAARTTNPGFAVGGGSNGRGFVKVSNGGTLNVTEQLKVGNASATGASAHAGFTLDSGTVVSGSWLVVGLNFDRALLTQTGGSLTVSSNRMTIGAGGNASIGVVNLSGGTFTVAAGANTGVFLGENGTGIMNVSGTAAVTLATNSAAASGTMQFGGNATSLAGNLNLLGGTLSTFGVTKGASTAGAVYQLGFNGGTLKALAPNPAFFAALANTDAYVYGGGGTIDNGGNAITITEGLQAPTGNGVSTTGLTVGGTGYLYPPIVTITGGGGTGATAIATIDAAGTLTGVQMTSPGVNYTSVPTFALVGGGAGSTGALGGAATLVANTSGGMAFTGAGTTTINGPHTFTGPISVSGGKLAIGGVYGNAVNVAATGGLIVADPAAAVGSLTVNSLSLTTGSSLTFETGGTTLSDKIIVSNASGLSFGNVGINLYDTGTTNAATPGTYTLFQYTTSFTGSLSGLSVLNPRAGYNYNFANTGSAITVQVVSLDADGDGMTDAYELANGLNPNDATGVNGANGNLDGDFATNYEEFLAGTAANNPASDPLNTDNDGLPDSWEVTYFGSKTAQTGSDDFDGDFDSNLMEFTKGTNPASAASFTDSEPDGLGDGWEILYFGNTTSKNGTADSDGDLFTDAQEYKYGSNPTDSSLSPAFAKLAHRWSFTNNLNDSVGTSNATIQNGTTSNTNPVTQNATSVTLAGGAKADSQWVKLGSNLMPSRNTPCTIETWATLNAVQNFARIWDFHTNTDENLYMSWSVGTGVATDRVEWKDTVDSITDNTNNYIVGTKYHIVMTIAPSPTAGSSIVKWYSAPAYDGVTNFDLGPAIRTLTVTNSVALLNDVVNALGYSPWPDGTASATYDEFRIWDGALTEWALQSLHEQGPDNVTQLDSDNDKLPDAFENFYFHSLAAGPNTDSDGDLSSNIQELFAGSNPADATSSPNDSDADGLPDAWELGYFGNLDQDGNGDPDGDFAFNSEELAASTNPTLYTSFPDSDGDGMSDGWENSYFQSLADNGTSDTDGDHVNSLAEFIAKSNPLDPLSPGAADGDADDDGLPDRWETTYFSATNLATQNGTADSDGDGANNLAEYEATSDPTSNLSTPTDINGDGTPDQHVFRGLTAAGSGVQDKDGMATPFTNRLAGTGTTIPTVDPNLDLVTTAPGTLSLTSSTSDINNQVNMAELESVGIPLSSLGFTGTQDFRIRAHYVNMPVLGGFDQIGAYVGTSSTNMTRAAKIGGNNQGLGVNTNGTIDTGGFFGANGSAGLAGQDMTVVIERIGGVWTMTCNGQTCTALAQPTFLDGLANLEAGVFVLDGGNAAPTHKTAVLESFTAVAFSTGGGSPDSDADGLDDAWEIANFGNITAQTGTGDADKDGTNNRTEFLLGLSPTNGAQRFRTLTSSVVAGSTVTLTWPAQNGLTFTVARSTNLASWTPTGGTITATGTTATYTDATAPAGKVFYRVTLTTP